MLVKLTTNPNGMATNLNTSVWKKTKIPSMSFIAKAIKNVGIKAVNERETPAGTVSGIFTMILRLTQNT